MRILEVYLPLAASGLGILVVLGLWGIWRNRRARRKRRAIFQGRDASTIDNWYMQQIAPLGISLPTALKVAEGLSSVMRCHLTQVLPSDSFLEELKFHGVAFLGIDSDDDMETFEEIVLRELIGDAGCRELERRGRQIFTVGDLMRFCEDFVNNERQLMRHASSEGQWM